jgi:hypothetical protein
VPAENALPPALVKTMQRFSLHCCSRSNAPSVSVISFVKAFTDRRSDDPRHIADMFHSRKSADFLRVFRRVQNTHDIHTNIINFSTFHKVMSLGVVPAC